MLWPLVADPWRQIHRETQVQGYVPDAIIDRDPATEISKSTEPRSRWKTEAVGPFIGSGQKHLVEQFDRRVAVAEPAFDTRLERKVPHTMREQKYAPALGPNLRC